MELCSLSASRWKRRSTSSSTTIVSFFIPPAYQFASNPACQLPGIPASQQSCQHNTRVVLSTQPSSTTTARHDNTGASSGLGGNRTHVLPLIRRPLQPLSYQPRPSANHSDCVSTSRLSAPLRVHATPHRAPYADKTISQHHDRRQGRNHQHPQRSTRHTPPPYHAMT